MKNKISMIQQGDVTLRKVTKEELKQAVKVKNDKRGVVLAEGEVTGHYHGIEEVEDAELYRIGERMLLSVEKPVQLKHQEHHAITIEPGIWEIGIVREWDYLKGMSAPVVD